MRFESEGEFFDAIERLADVFLEDPSLLCCVLANVARGVAEGDVTGEFATRFVSPHGGFEEEDERAAFEETARFLRSLADMLDLEVATEHAINGRSE